MSESNGAHDRAVITLALGPKVYWQMAVNLARSIRRWHPAEELPVTIVTDSANALPADLSGVTILKLRSGELGVGFQTKLHLDRLAPARRTLFIDADCLVYARLDEAFARYAGRPVGIIQERLASEGEWFGDIAAYCRYLHVEKLPLFTGGFYYVEREQAGPIYDDARELFTHYDEIGLVRLRGLPNEELLVAGAMARRNLWGLPHDGMIMGDFQTSPGPHSLNVLRGHRQLSNPPAGDPAHCAWAPVRKIQPAIVHFLAYHTHLPPYRAEVAALAWSAAGLPAGVAGTLSRLLILFPGLFYAGLKTFLRPLYHRLFGIRAVPRSDRAAG